MDEQDNICKQNSMTAYPQNFKVFKIFNLPDSIVALKIIIHINQHLTDNTNLKATITY